MAVVLTMTDWREGRWPSRFFAPSELACRCCGIMFVHADFLARVDSVRERFGTPLIVSSGYRCRLHNKAVGGAENSYHTRGRAMDLASPRSDARYELVRLATDMGFGVGVYGTFIHLDDGPPRIWPG